MPVLLWSDVLIWLLALAGAALAVLSWRNPPSRAAWRRIGANRPGMAAATLLAVFALVGLADSLHYRPRLAGSDPERPAVHAVEVLSALDALAAPLRLATERTYSAPLATRAYAKETTEIRAADGRLRATRDFPRLKYGGAHLGDDEAGRDGDVLQRALAATFLAGALFIALSLAAAGVLARRAGGRLGPAWSALWKGETGFAWNAVLATLGVLLLVLLPILALCGDYHVFGTDKVGQDVFYQILKSVRTALVIGLVTTLVTLPLAIALGILAGYFRGWVDDAIQYLYTTLSSIPGVLLIAAAVLMMQVLIDTHPKWFATAAERADLRLLALCFILGLTSWTSLCRLLRGETLKLRELEYIQAAQAFGVADLSILRRHILPNLMHIVIIALVMDFSGLVLAEAVLSYIGIGVDPTMMSFGTMINNARMELSREPAV
ncbi:MAG: ABC transporter permease, partial [Candidatus Accumulibacter sp.]|nr:ABC transporter permease [Accumulibacter sp.]